MYTLLHKPFQPGAVARSDAPGMRRAAGSILTSGNILSWRLVYGHSLPSADSRRAVVSYWRKNVH